MCVVWAGVCAERLPPRHGTRCTRLPRESFQTSVVPCERARYGAKAARTQAVRREGRGSGRASEPAAQGSSREPRLLCPRSPAGRHDTDRLPTERGCEVGALLGQRAEVARRPEVDVDRAAAREGMLPHRRRMPTHGQGQTAAASSYSGALGEVFHVKARSQPTKKIVVKTLRPLSHVLVQ